MNVIGHGIDIVDLGTFARLVNDAETDFLSRCFTEAELAQFDASPDRLEHLAGRFAAKEAVAKALGSGFDGKVSPRDIEITNLASGAPTVRLSGGSLRHAARQGVKVWLLSIAHMPPSAIASAISLGMPTV
jgi:holo-[acyl-carrier protein] synthase